jgi:cytochrome c2
MTIRHCAAAVTVVVLAAPGADAQDAARGKALYEACAACHKLEPASTEHGPTLIGVIGRKAGAIDDFRYSRALLRAGVVWDEVTLDAYLAEPQGFIAGTRMPFSGIPERIERADLIAYLTTLR